jgi:hypothetical protein
MNLVSKRPEGVHATPRRMRKNDAGPGQENPS